MMTNGTILRKLRERKHLSQKEIAEKLDVAQSTYSQWESDLSSYKVDMLPKLAEVLDVDIVELIPKGTTVKIVNNSNNNNGSVNAFQVQMDARKLHDDLFSSYEAIIKAKDEIIESKKEVIEMLRSETAKLRE
jgi:transcriptional regulator with XRE-family HTH domain